VEARHSQTWAPEYRDLIAKMMVALDPNTLPFLREETHGELQVNLPEEGKEHPGGAAGGKDFEKVLYFIQRSGPGEVRGVYRVQELRDGT